MSEREGGRVVVCDRCLRASCWQGVFMCDESVGAGIRSESVAVLRRLKRESPHYWNPASAVAPHDTGG